MQNGRSLCHLKTCLIPPGCTSFINRPDNCCPKCAGNFYLILCCLFFFLVIRQTSGVPSILSPECVPTLYFIRNTPLYRFQNCKTPALRKWKKRKKKVTIFCQYLFQYVSVDKQLVKSFWLKQFVSSSHSQVDI